MFTLHLHHLKEGTPFCLEDDFDPSFLDIHEEDLQFVDPVHVKVKIEKKDSLLIFHLSLNTYATIPCSICNQPTKTPLTLKDYVHTEEMASYTHAHFDYTEILREALLVDVPFFIECHDGNCPERKHIASYLKTKN